MTKSLFVGLDVCEAVFEACFMNDEGKRVAPQRKYPNTPEGFKLFRADSLAFSRLITKRAPIIIGMESTGNFHIPLYTFLTKRFKIRLINPYCIKKFRKAHFILSKTDKIDSEIIARYIKAFPSKPSSPFPPHQLSLRSLTRFRRVLLNERTRCINRLRKNLRTILPGYKRIIGKKIHKDFLLFLSINPDFENISSPSPFRKLINILQKDYFSIFKDEIQWTAERTSSLTNKSKSSREKSKSL